MTGARPAPKLLGPDAERVARSVEISEREYASLEKVAILRGLCGKYRRALRDIMDFPERAGDIARQALEESPS